MTDRMSSSDFINSSEGFRNAQMINSVSLSIMNDALRTAVHDGVESGMSSRGIAKALGIRLRDVLKIRYRNHQVIPIHGNARIWDSLYSMTWEHDDSMLKDHPCPYKWIQHPDGSKTIELIQSKLNAKICRNTDG